MEAVTYRFRGHSMADPEQYRSKEEVERWRERDPLGVFARQLIREGVIDEAAREQIDKQAIARVDAAVEFAENSPFPAPESLYDDVYVLDSEVQGLYSVDTGEDRAHATGTADGGPGAEAAAGRPAPSANDEIPQQLTDALAVGENGHEKAERAP